MRRLHLAEILSILTSSEWGYEHRTPTVGPAFLLPLYCLFILIPVRGNKDKNMKNAVGGMRRQQT